MTRLTILGVGCGAIAAVAAGLGTAPAARADVLEVSYGGHRWIAGGGQLAEPSDAGAAPDAAEIELPTALADSGTPRLAIPPAYAEKVRELSARFDLSPALIEALVWQESRWRANAVSPAGARGLAQLMPGTARELGVDPSDPYANLEGGARYLRAQLDRFDGDVEKALAAYNAGPGRVIAANGIPRIRETQHYVTAIFGRLSDHSRR
ncbi:lytic transglycosylase domain-containing protein [Tsuneonella sp. CC-YZS046]|uniref:lytic transglycosylase domain-containing protein n=1 Tax=Tsuneonella sp. CC-YZS046 TaxID=3042152 RepID=UPI002D780515|nr:lytic transglycosylase domain-containing protein [Tsuneonella sp. CC-YZS046]WRO65676.1 lytic transglycosylase domain-containing protein [Tsuneonella sp. CC-YZS046]